MGATENMMGIMGGFFLGVCVGVLLICLWNWAWPSQTFNLDGGKVILDANQQNQIYSITKDLNEGFDQIMGVLCANREGIIQRIQAIPLDARELTIINCNVLKTTTSDQLIDIISQQTGMNFMGGGNPIAAAILKLYIDKALSTYCTGAEFNYALYKTHLIRGVQTLCNSGSELRHMFINIINYVLLTPLSFMS